MEDVQSVMANGEALIWTLVGLEDICASVVELFGLVGMLINILIHTNFNLEANSNGFLPHCQPAESSFSVLSIIISNVTINFFEHSSHFSGIFPPALMFSSG